jgi:hypothetical protein
MATKSKVDLINRTLKCLGALPFGQEANDEDYNNVDELVGPMQANLRERDVYFLADTNVVPEDAFVWLSHVLAWMAAPDFGQQHNADLYQLGQDAENKLQILQAERPHYTTLEVQAY